MVERERPRGREGEGGGFDFFFFLYLKNLVVCWFEVVCYRTSEILGEGLGLVQVILWCGLVTTLYITIFR